MLTANQNARELNVSMKNGIKANLDNINNVIDLSVDRTIINFMPALKIVLELAHPTGYNKNRSETTG